MKKKILILTAITLGCSLALSYTAPTILAAETITEAVESAEADTEKTVTAETAYPVTVIDQLGREVTIEEEPQTLVSGYYIGTSLLIALGQADKLTGIEAKAGSRPIYKLSAPELLSLPSVGTAKEFDLEGCAALEPDLIILPAKLKDVIPTLEQLGLTVLAIRPENQQLLEEAVSLLARVLGRPEAEDALLNFGQEHLAGLTSALENTETPAVYLAGNSSLLSTAGSQMYQHTLITNAGGKNVAAELEDDYWTDISYEQLLAWDPEFIILTADASYTIDSVLNDPNLSQCTAVKEQQVYQFPNAIEAWDSPVPSTVLGSLWLASVLHPQECGSDWEQAVTEYYETFYDFTPDLTNLYEAAE